MKTIGIVSAAVLLAMAGLGISAGAIKQAAAKPVAQSPLLIKLGMSPEGNTWWRKWPCAASAIPPATPRAI